MTMPSNEEQQRQLYRLLTMIPGMPGAMLHHGLGDVPTLRHPALAKIEVCAASPDSGDGKVYDIWISGRLKVPNLTLDEAAAWLRGKLPPQKPVKKPAHRPELYFPDGRKVTGEVFPVGKASGFRGHCKYCRQAHEEWWIMPAEYGMGDQSGVLCAYCEHVSLAAHAEVEAA